MAKDHLKLAEECSNKRKTPTDESSDESHKRPKIDVDSPDTSIEIAPDGHEDDDVNAESIVEAVLVQATTERIKTRSSKIQKAIIEYGEEIQPQFAPPTK